MKQSIFCLIVMLFTSCSKEFSTPTPPSIPEIKITIKGETYFTTVNGVSGYYWKIILSSNKPIPILYSVTYEYDDSNSRRLAVSHVMNENQTSNSAMTHILAPSQDAKISNVKIVQVNGAPGYKFILSL